jgi:hypothetical protein
MPSLTRWYIKSAFVYLGFSFLVGLLLTVDRFVLLPRFIQFMSPAYFHLFMVGWVTQMIFGVIYWMFPIISRDSPRGNSRLGWVSFVLLNAGLLLRVIFEPFVALIPQRSVWGWSLVVSAVFQWFAAFIFVVLSWPRVKERYRGG